MKRLMIVSAAFLAGCVDGGGPVYVPQFEPMDATPYMRQPAAPTYPQSKVCPNGYIASIHYLC